MVTSCLCHSFGWWIVILHSSIVTKGPTQSWRLVLKLIIPYHPTPHHPLCIRNSYSPAWTPKWTYLHKTHLHMIPRTSFPRLCQHSFRNENFKMSKNVFPASRPSDSWTPGLWNAARRSERSSDANADHYGSTVPFTKYLCRWTFVSSHHRTVVPATPDRVVARLLPSNSAFRWSS